MDTKMHVLEKKDFQEQIIKTLYESYQLGNSLCDVVIYVKDVTIKAHKAVLASFSLYFANIFMHKDLHACNMEPDVDARCLVLLLNYMYTGLLSIDGVSQLSMYETSVKLNIPSAQELLLRVLGSVNILPNGTDMITKFIGTNSYTPNKTNGRSKNKKSTCLFEPELKPCQTVAGNSENLNENIVGIQRNERLTMKQNAVKFRKSRKRYLEGINDQTLDGKPQKKITKKELPVCRPLKIKLTAKIKELKTKSKTQGKISKKQHIRKKIICLNKVQFKSQCNLCSRSFKLYGSMHRHMVTNHKSIMCALKQNIYHRWIFGRFFPRKLLHNRPKKSLNSELALNQEQDISISSENYPIKQTDINVAELNGYSEFSASCILTETAKYNCICGQNFFLYSNFTLHARRKHMVKKPKPLFALVRKCLLNCIEMYGKKNNVRKVKFKKKRRRRKSQKYLPVPADAQEYPAHCHICFIEQTSEDSMVQHLVSDHRYHLHDAQKEVGVKHSLTCKICGKCCDSRESLSIHQGIAHAEAKICPHCKGNFRSVVTLKKHLRTHHNLSAQDVKYLMGEVMACEEENCNFKTCSGFKLKKHVMQCHPETEYRCPECGYLFHVRSQRDKHVKERHSHNLVKANRNMCTDCGKTFSKPYHLMNHKYTAHGIQHPNLKIYKCEYPDCNYQGVTKSVIKQHVKIKHSERTPIPCPHCDKELRSEIILRKHINKMHLNIRPFMCHVCGLAFGEPAELQSHINSRHTDEKQFQCEYCPYATSNKCTFRTHLFMVHKVQADNDNRPVYSCDQCNFVTILKRRFRTHMNRHQNIREYVCKICNKTFMTSSTLRTHVQWNHSSAVFPCPDCDYKTKTRQKLNEHIRIQHMLRGVKPYKCPYCDFHCSSGGNCRKHIMQRHKGLEVYYEKDDSILATAKAASQTGASISVVRHEDLGSHCNTHWGAISLNAEGQMQMDVASLSNHVTNHMNNNKGLSMIQEIHSTSCVGSICTGNDLPNSLVQVQPVVNNSTLTNVAMYHTSS